MIHQFLHTSVSRVRGNLSEELDKVWKVVAEELGSNNEVFAGVVGEDVGTQQLRLALNSESRTSVGVLCQGQRCVVH